MSQPSVTENKTQPELVEGCRCLCGGSLRLDHVDDAKTHWFKCERCGQQTTKQQQGETNNKGEDDGRDDRDDTSLSSSCLLSSANSELKKDLQTSQQDMPHVQPARSLDAPHKKLSQADKLVLLCTQRHPILFCDQVGTPYARIEWRGVLMTMQIRSQAFKAWLANLLWLSEEKAPGTQAIYSASNVLVAMANSGTKYTLYNRVAPGENCIWINMCDDLWRAIKVTVDGWQIVQSSDVPIVFKKYSHQLPLAEPKTGGNAWKLLDFFNVDRNDESTCLPLICVPISYFVPNISHLILCLYGHQGSAKSWMFRFIRRLIDPSVVELLALPWEERERVQQLDHHWLAFYDNITWLPTQASDTLCRAATGGGFSKRELYSNDDDVVYDFRRCIGLNGINIPAQRGDLLDRVFLVGLHNIPNSKRKTEDEIVADFEACKAEILGGFLDTLVKAMRLYPTIKLKGLFRMADFTKWGCAIAVALGKTTDDFIKAYESKVKGQIEEAVYQSPVATVLIDFLESAKGRKWEGSPTELFKILRSHADDIGISTRQKIWPRAPNALVRKLNELAPSLKSLGYEIDTSKSGPTRRIGINTVPTVPTVPTIQEILESIRVGMGSVFAEDKILAEIMQLGFSPEEAQKRVDHFKQKEVIVKDDVGGWHFQ